jgi:hypothetical protein
MTPVIGVVYWWLGWAARARLAIDMLGPRVSTGRWRLYLQWARRASKRYVKILGRLIFYFDPFYKLFS